MQETMAYKTKVCQRCGTEYQPTSGPQKYCAGCGLMVTAVKRRARAKVFYRAHLEKVQAENRCWKRAHPEYDKNYTLAHPGRTTPWHQVHPEQGIAWKAQHPEKVKLASRKHGAKRHTLGFIPLNSPFPGSDVHHLDHDHVLYIPTELHESIRHNVLTGQGMQQINAAAYKWLAGTNQ